MALRQQEGARPRAARRSLRASRAAAARAARLRRRSASGRAVAVAQPHRGAERLEVRLASQADGHGLEASGRAWPDTAPRRPARSWSKAICPCSISTRARPSSSSASESTALEQSQCGVERTGIAVGAGRRQQPRGSAGWVGRQRRGAPQERGGGAEPAASLRARRGALQFHGDRFVRSRRRLGQMPRTTVWVELRIGRLRQGEVHRLALLLRGRSVDRRAYERVAEHHPLADGQQPFGRVGAGRRQPDAEALGRAPHQQRVVDRLRRRHEQQQPRLLGERLEPPQEALLDPPRRPMRALQPEPARQLRCRQRPRQLQDRQRIAARLGDEPVADALIEPARDDGREQGARVLLGEPCERQLRQARPTRARRSGRGPRTRSPPTRPAAVARRSRGPAPKRHRATGRHRRNTAAAAPRRPRPAG